MTAVGKSAAYLKLNYLFSILLLCEIRPNTNTGLDLPVCCWYAGGRLEITRRGTHQLNSSWVRPGFPSLVIFTLIKTIPPPIPATNPPLTHWPPDVSFWGLLYCDEVSQYSFVQNLCMFTNRIWWQTKLWCGLGTNTSIHSDTNKTSITSTESPTKDPCLGGERQRQKHYMFWRFLRLWTENVTGFCLRNLVTLVYGRVLLNVLNVCLYTFLDMYSIHAR